MLKPIAVIFTPAWQVKHKTPQEPDEEDDSDKAMKISFAVK